MSQSKKGLWRLFALLIALTLVLAACGSDDKKESATDTTAKSGGDGGKKAVTLAFVGPLTGDNANLGINIRNGMKVAIEEANKASSKFTYSIKEFDTQGDPAQAPAQKDKYVADNSIVGIVGPTFSGETKAVLPDLETAKLVMISASATNVALPTIVPNGKVFHRVIPDDGVQAEGLASYVEKVIKPKSVALIHDNSEYGKGLFSGVLELLDKANIKTAITEAIDPKGQDYSAAVNKVKAANVDLVFYGGYYAEAGRLKKQLSDAGVKAKFLSGDGSLDKGFIDAAGAAGGEGALISCPCRLATADASGKVGDFAKNYKRISNSDPGTYSAEGYDAARILIKGIEAGNDTRAKLLDYVESLSSFDDSISKASISFLDNGNVKSGDVYVYEVKGGKLTELGTTEKLAGGSSSSSSSSSSTSGSTTSGSGSSTSTTKP